MRTSSAVYGVMINTFTYQATEGKSFVTHHNYNAMQSVQVIITGELSDDTNNIRDKLNAMMQNYFDERRRVNERRDVVHVQLHDMDRPFDGEIGEILAPYKQKYQFTHIIYDTLPDQGCFRFGVGMVSPVPVISSVPDPAPAITL